MEENYRDAEYFNPLKYFLSLIIYKILYYKILYEEISDKYKAQLFRNVITFLYLFVVNYNFLHCLALINIEDHLLI